MTNQEKIWVLHELISSCKNRVISAEKHLLTEENQDKIKAFQKTIFDAPAKIKFFEEQIDLLTNSQ